MTDTNALPGVDTSPGAGNTPSVDVANVVTATPSLIDRLPAEIWLKIFGYVTLIPEYALIEDVPDQTYMDVNKFHKSHKRHFRGALQSCRIFNAMCMETFYSVNALGFGYAALSHYDETRALLPPLLLRRHLRRIHLALVLRDFYHPAPGECHRPILSVQDLFQHSHNAGLLRALNNVAGFNNLESLRLSVTGAFMYDPFTILTLLKQANITLTAGRVRVRMAIFQAFRRLTLVKNLFNIVQTVDTGSPTLGGGVDFDDLTADSFVQIPADNGTRYKMHERHRTAAMDW